MVVASRVAPPEGLSGAVAARKAWGAARAARRNAEGAAAAAGTSAETSAGSGFGDFGGVARHAGELSVPVVDGHPRALEALRLAGESKSWL